MENAFNKGYREVAAKDQQAVKAELMEALGINHVNPFYRHRDGIVKHNPAEREAIERIFAKYGVKQPWGK